MSKLESEANFGQEKIRQLKEENENLRHQIKNLETDFRSSKLDQE